MKVVVMTFGPGRFVDHDVPIYSLFRLQSGQDPNFHFWRVDVNFIVLSCGKRSLLYALSTIPPLFLAHLCRHLHRCVSHLSVFGFGISAVNNRTIVVS